jgi:hypothetical protein
VLVDAFESLSLREKCAVSLALQASPSIHPVDGRDMMDTSVGAGTASTGDPMAAAPSALLLSDALALGYTTSSSASSVVGDPLLQSRTSVTLPSPNVRTQAQPGLAAQFAFGGHPASDQHQPSHSPASSTLEETLLSELSIPPQVSQQPPAVTLGNEHARSVAHALALMSKDERQVNLLSRLYSSLHV